jgi:predicted RecA/RadA family phage recombinase
MPANRAFRIRYAEFAQKIPLLNNSGAAMGEGDGFYIDPATDLVTVLAAINTVGLTGVWAAPVAAGAVGWAYITGIFEVDSELGVDFGQGEAVYSASATTVDTGAAGDVALGYIVGGDPALNETPVLIRIRSTLLDQTIAP